MRTMLLPNILLTGQARGRAVLGGGAGLGRRVPWGVGRPKGAVRCSVSRLVEGRAAWRLSGPRRDRFLRWLWEAGWGAGNVDCVGPRLLGERGRLLQVLVLANCRIFRNLVFVCKSLMVFLFLFLLLICRVCL